MPGGVSPVVLVPGQGYQYQTRSVDTRPRVPISADSALLKWLIEVRITQITMGGRCGGPV